MSTVTQVEIESVTQLLLDWLEFRASQEGLQWLEQKRQKIAEGAPERVFFTSFSAVPRYLGKADLNLTEEDLQAANKLRSGWFPGNWRVDEVGRTLLILALPSNSPEKYLLTLRKVFTTADEGELVALYQSLPLLPHPELHKGQASEGVRSNMTTVFNAVAQCNPYPADYFDKIAWNQMVLKALFVGSPLYLIYGLDDRANPELAKMLSDYAHERWAAGRTVSPELWRSVGLFIDERLAQDLEKVISDRDPVQQEAAALACSQSNSPAAQAILARHPQLKAAIAAGSLTWESFSQKHLTAS
ncbi:EboA family metabolite traffic protein [Oscillatoria salina]|uniref:EboA family metabolite traffic protein n=1 Tax=Oscillatoria salina TaxID=331517 RepID=UPI0013B9A1B3|nr:EboA family metabolite traffic protein [Oscillatoria salina]MBZ8178889.1 EboA family metabolite traffic protein [Oscillatoria salina IIICB1]NET86685.1 EboA family metabolite traffic protein [Kamptonema sp. SIO1D9]